MAENYKFPDEQDEELANQDVSDELDADNEGADIEIDIEDDTPERDRNAQPLDKNVEDPTDE